MKQQNHSPKDDYSVLELSVQQTHKLQGLKPYGYPTKLPNCSTIKAFDVYKDSIIATWVHYW